MLFGGHFWVRCLWQMSLVMIGWQVNPVYVHLPNFSDGICVKSFIVWVIPKHVDKCFIIECCYLRFWSVFVVNKHECRELAKFFLHTYSQFFHELYLVLLHRDCNIKIPSGFVFVCLEVSSQFQVAVNAFPGDVEDWPGSYIQPGLQQVEVFVP